MAQGILGDPGKELPRDLTSVLLPDRSKLRLQQIIFNCTSPPYGHKRVRDECQPQANKKPSLCVQHPTLTAPSARRKVYDGNAHEVQEEAGVARMTDDVVWGVSNERMGGAQRHFVCEEAAQNAVAPRSDRGSAQR